MKKNYTISLCTIDRVKNWANKAFNFNGTIHIMSNEYVIDGKSILGIFSLDLTNNLKCEVKTDDKATLREFEELMKDFIIA